MTNFHSLLDEFFNYLVIDLGESQNTVNAYSHDLFQYGDFLEHEQIPTIHDIKEEHVMQFLSSLYDIPLSAKTISRKLSAIRSFHKFLFINNYCRVNPVSFIDLPKVKKSLPEVLTIEEVNQFIESFPMNDEASIRNRAIVELLYSTGLRVSELVNLNLEDINLTMGFLRCKGKGSKERMVPIGERATHLLNEYITYNRQKFNFHYETQVVFLNDNGLRMTRHHVWSLIHGQAKKVGLNIYPHKLRHSYATHMLDNKVDIRYIQELLGHSDISTTQIYTHVNLKKLSDVMDEYHPRNIKKEGKK